MPYIAVNLTKKLSRDETQALKTELGRAISMLPGKNESALMLDITDGKTIFFGGELMECGAFVDVRMYGKAERDLKGAYTREVYAIMQRTVGVAPDKMFLNFTEFDSWGAFGDLR